MKKVLLLVHEYYPCGSAITNCLNPIIEELKNQKISVDVVTRRQKKELKKFETIDGVNVYRINDWFNIYNNEINSSKSKLKKFIYKVALKFVWIYRTKIAKIKSGFININKATKKCKNLFSTNQYDTVISCSFPFSMHKIAYNLKKDNNLVWIAYQFDPHSYNVTLISDGLLEDRVKEEIEILSLAEKIFLPKENFEENLKTKLSVLKNKYFPFPFALINKPNFDVINEKNKKIVFAFAGTLYENIRTPFKMLDFFKNIDLDYEIQLYYIAETTLEEKLLFYKKEFGNKLKLFSNKNKKECDIAISKANVLINIGNEMSNQTPSKVYELISYGKPIINFYSINEDTSKKVLEQYPIVLNIYKDYTKKDIEKFINFIEENQNKILTYEEATKNYKTAEEVAKEFIKEVNSCHEQNKK